MLENPFSLLNRHVNVSHETVDRLVLYHDLLVKWQPKINLVSSDSLPEAWTRHFLDSLQLINFLPKEKQSIIDFGSGAGFPGLVLAIARADEVHLVESDAKKIAFLREAARLTGAKVIFYHGRVEDCPPIKVNFVVARAVANLDVLLSYSSSFVSHETTCLFHKGKNYSKEIKDASEKWQFDYNAIPSVTDTEGVILQLSNIRRQGI